MATTSGNAKLPLQVLYNTLPAEEVKIIYYTYLNLSVVKLICRDLAMISGNSVCLCKHCVTLFPLKSWMSIEITGLKGNSKFCVPETLNVTRSKAERNTEGRGEPKLTVSWGASHWVFCYTSQLKTRIKCEKMICLTPCLRLLRPLTSGNRNQVVIPKGRDNSLFFSQLTKKKTMLKLL